MSSDVKVTEDQIDAFQRDGCLCLRGLFADWIGAIADGIDRNLNDPGETARLNLADPGEGRFFEDYCNWQRIPEFRDLVLQSPAAEVAAKVMRSSRAQFYHEHVLVKEPGAIKPTPWHQDHPYYFTQGRQTVSYWIPVDPVREATLRLIAGSHHWPRGVQPTKWADGSNFYEGQQNWRPAPDPDANRDRYQVLEWALDPGDCVLFSFDTVHGARGNLGSQRRRALSLRWVGDDVRYISRPGKTSPPFPGHGMLEGETLREDWFPIVYTAA